MARTAPRMRFRRRLYDQLFPDARSDRGLSVLNRVIIVLILFGLVLYTLETEPSIRAFSGGVLFWAELTLSVLFALEYTLRLWAAGEDRRYRGLTGRLRYMVTPMALIDLFAFLPTFLTLGTNNAFVLRASCKTQRMAGIFAAARAENEY